MSDLITQRYTVSGMTCGHCVAAVTEELSSIDGVESVEVDLATGGAVVVSTAPVPIAAVEAAVDEAGYELADAGS